MVVLLSSGVVMDLVIFFRCDEVWCRSKIAVCRALGTWLVAARGWW